MSKSPWKSDQIADQKGRLVIITGATSGIGKEAARVLAGKRARVVIGARNQAKAEKVLSETLSEFPEADISARPLDLSDLSSVESFATSILNDFDRLDVLINNAGIMMSPFGRTADGFELQMGTNHLGHFALCGHLLPLLKKTSGSRLVVLSSLAHKMGDIDLNDLNWKRRKYKTTRAYSDSKLANILFAYELARKLKVSGDESPRVTIAHPGWTGTELQRHSGWMGFLNKVFAQGIEMGALPTLRAGFDDTAKSGDFFGPSRFFEMHGEPVPVKSSALAQNHQAAGHLWEESQAMCRITY